MLARNGSRSIISAYRRAMIPRRPLPIYTHHFSSLCSPSPAHEPAAQQPAPEVTVTEAKRLMRLVNVEALKRKLGEEGGEVIAYDELLKACEDTGVARTGDEAEAFARALDETGVVLLFRDKVYLHPDKVVDLVRKAVPLALTPSDDPRKAELKKLIAKKQEIDKLAHKQVRRILFTGLAGTILHVGLFFRLTFWEFSWDVMEPIAFFTTATGLIVGYGYFLITDRDPTYQDFMERLFSSRQKKLALKEGFNMERYLELRKCIKDPYEKICRDNENGETDYDLSLHK